MEEVRQLYGMLVETDLANLLANDHFQKVAAENPNSSPTFSRTGLPALGQQGYSFQYSAPVNDLVKSSALRGRNGILRNRAIIVLLFAKWEEYYRKKLALILGISPRSIVSDIFGDLRLYRNALAHGGSTLKQPTKVLQFVEVGQSIDLAADMDELFRIVVNELNRLSEAYLQVPSSFTLDMFSPAILVARGQSWREH